MEELVAELSASFLCADLGVAHDPRGNTASYPESWLKVLKNDKRAIVTAVAKAQAADGEHKFPAGNFHIVTLVTARSTLFGRRGARRPRRRRCLIHLTRCLAG